jgi:hypothetical protein
MVSFDSEEGLDALPRRIFLEGEQRPFPILMDSSVRSRALFRCAISLSAQQHWSSLRPGQERRSLLNRSKMCCLARAASAPRTSFEPGEAPGRNGRLLTFTDEIGREIAQPSRLWRPGTDTPFILDLSW